MKWWGWGEEGISFRYDDKPALPAFFKENLDFDVTEPPVSVPDFHTLPIPPSRVPHELRDSLEAVVGPGGLKDDPLDRIVHAYGKSLRDLVRIRRGDFGRPPDVVVYPASEDEVVRIVKLALASDAVVIPFGGGTSFVGCLEAPRNETRPVVSVDMCRMNQVLEIDEHSRLARIQTGALGPDIERQLNARNWTVGHFPDSFNHASLGGWIATRSVGMQSDKYGDVAELTKAVRVVTSAGVLVTRAVPSESAGPSVKEMILGSEGRLGIITEATVHVHRIPQKRQIYGYLFPDWSRGLRAMAAISESDAYPSVTRVSDVPETRFYFAMKKRERMVGHVKSAFSKLYLRHVKGFDLHRVCLSYIGYEGSEEHVNFQKRQVDAIAAQHGGICIGTGPGDLYDQKKFDVPYIRDFLLDRGVLGDVSETAAGWSQLEPLYNGVMARAAEAFKKIDVRGFIMCHLSHSYHCGACLYFTFAFRPSNPDRLLDEYDLVKRTIQQSFIDFGGTLSHHHAVGVEHAPWLSEDISPAGVAMVRSLFDGVDPGHNFNPGKIV